MLIIAESFGQFMPWVFCIIVFGIISDTVIRAFEGRF